MKKETRISLRNKIVKFLNEKEMLGCRVYSGIAPISKKRVQSKERFFWRFVSGTAKDGRTILIYPIPNRSERIPISIFEHMALVEDMGAIVGTSHTIGDAFIIVVDSPEYKRTNQTRMHRYFLERYKKEKEHGSEKIQRKTRSEIE